MANRLQPSAVIKIDSQYRLQFPRRIRQYVRFFIEDKSVNGWLRIGSMGQLLAFADPKWDRALAHLDKALASQPVGHHEESGTVARALRSLEAAFPCAFNFEPESETFRMTLPDEVRKLDLVPAPDKCVLCLFLGGFIEIWGLDLLSQLGRAVPSLKDIENALGIEEEA
jgi:hypothetical protein